MESCVHGERIHKTGVSAKTGKPWSAAMCPAPKGEGQCEPFWLKNDAPAPSMASSEVVELLTRIAVAVERMAGSN